MPTHPAAVPNNTPTLFRCGVILCLLMLCSLDALASKLHVTIIPSRDNGAYQHVVDAIVSRLGEQPTPSISLKIATLDEFKQHSKRIDQDSDLLIPIGIRATDSVIREAGTTPVLASLVLRASFHASLRQREKETQMRHGKRRISAILLDQPVSRQLHLTRLLFGRIKRIGIPLGPNSQSLSREIERTARQLKLSIDIENIDSADNLMRQLSQLLDRSDVLLALPDPVVFNRRNVRYILLGTYRKRIPVIGFSRSYVQAGALAATYSSPEKIGKQTAEAIIRWQKNPSLELPADIPPKYFSVAINEQVARSFGYIDLSAQALAQKIRQFERGRK